MDLSPRLLSLLPLPDEGKQGLALGKQPAIELALTLIPLLLAPYNSMGTPWYKWLCCSFYMLILKHRPP